MLATIVCQTICLQTRPKAVLSPFFAHHAEQLDRSFSACALYCITMYIQYPQSVLLPSFLLRKHLSKILQVANPSLVQRFQCVCAFLGKTPNLHVNDLTLSENCSSASRLCDMQQGFSQKFSTVSTEFSTVAWFPCDFDISFPQSVTTNRATPFCI